MDLNLRSGCGVTLSPPTSLGASTRLTFASRAAGVICIGLSIQRVRRSISYGRPSATDAAQRLFRKALRDRSHPQPRVINTDLAPIYTSAIPAIKKEGTLRRRCKHRPVQYLNNILEQDHRAIKRRVNAKQGFREFHSAHRTIQGYEAINMLRKGQVDG